MELKLIKKKHSYINRDGKQAWAWNFVLQFGDQRIAIAPVKFSKDGKPDAGYNVRVSLLASVAEEAPNSENQ